MKSPQPQPQIALEQEIRGEADGSELRKILFEITDGDTTECAINEVFDKLPTALALWLEKATPEADGDLRGEMRKGLILRLVRVAESTGKDPNGNDYTEEEHYALYIKGEAGLLRAFEERFAMPVKNG